jgi:hypothetical protein
MRLAPPDIDPVSCTDACAAARPERSSAAVHLQAIAATKSVASLPTYAATTAAASDPTRQGTAILAQRRPSWLGCSHRPSCSRVRADWTRHRTTDPGPLLGCCVPHIATAGWRQLLPLPERRYSSVVSAPTRNMRLSCLDGGPPYIGALIFTSGRCPSGSGDGGPGVCSIDDDDARRATGRRADHRGRGRRDCSIDRCGACAGTDVSRVSR